MKSAIKIVLTVFLLELLLSACGNDRRSADLRKYIAQVRQNTARAPIKKTPPILKLPTQYKYSAEGLRSPFEAKESLQGVKRVTNNPIENYAVSMLVFKGTLTYNNQTVAYILAPDNKIYKVKVGDPIGDHYGKINKIFPDRVQIIEYDTDKLNQKKPRLVNLQLKGEG